MLAGAALGEIDEAEQRAAAREGRAADREERPAWRAGAVAREIELGPLDLAREERLSPGEAGRIGSRRQQAMIALRRQAQEQRPALREQPLDRLILAPDGAARVAGILAGDHGLPEHRQQPCPAASLAVIGWL
ncbi:hypothetical protein WMF30_18590 [Sorangium sp. So ce134]